MPVSRFREILARAKLQGEPEEENGTPRRQGALFEPMGHVCLDLEKFEIFERNLGRKSVYHSPRNFYKLIPCRFFFVIFFVIFTGIRCGHRFFL